MQKILISACLAGQKVRYDGKGSPLQCPILRQWLKEEKVVLFCPEVEGGLPIPRARSEIQGGDGHDVLAGRVKVRDGEGRDVTQFYLSGAQRGLNLVQQHRITAALLKSRSPACGCGEIYDGSFHKKLRRGDGVFTALLRQNGVTVLTELQMEEAKAYFAEYETTS